MNKQNGQIPQNRGMTVNVSRDDVELISCECGNDSFTPAAKLGNFPATHPKNPSGKAVLVPFQIYVCTGCGKELEHGKNEKKAKHE